MATTHVSSASELKAALASAKGGDTILLKSGSYGWVTLENFKFNDYVTIKSADGNGGAVFKHIGLNNTSHIRLDSLTAEFGPTTPQLHHLKAIEVRKTDHLQIINTEVIGHAGTKDWKDVPRGIQVWDGSSNIEIIDNHFHHLSRAVVVLGTRDVIIKENLIDDIHSDGTFFQNSSKILVEDNLLTDFYRTGTVHADYIQFDAGKGTADHNVVIRGNLMLKGNGNGDVQGIFGDAGDYYSIHQSTFKNFLIENNIYFDTGINGFHFWSGENMILRNNTVLMDPSTTHPNSPSRILMRGPQTNSVVENNVALQVSAEGGAKASGNVIVQFKDPSKANYYGKLFADAFADPATLADLAPKAGTAVGSGSGKGAEKLFQELLNGGGSPPANSAPVAGDDSASTAAGKMVAIKVLANDSDADGDALAVTSVSKAAHGTVARNADDTVSYTPAAGFTGKDGFTYTVSDGKGGTDTATVAVNVGAAVVASAINAGGGAANGYGVDQYFSGGRTAKTAAAIDGTTNDALYQSERYGDFSYAVPVANGAYQVTLKFAEFHWNAAGARVFDVTAEGKLIVNDLDIFSAAGGKNKAYDVTVPVTVNDGTLNLNFITVKDNAKISAIHITSSDGSGPANRAPVAEDDSASTVAGKAVAIKVLANDSDADGDALAVTSVSKAAHGTVARNADDTVSYTPAAGFTGKDGFTYTVSDGKGGTDTATVAVNVAAASTTLPTPLLASAAQSFDGIKGDTLILPHQNSYAVAAGTVELAFIADTTSGVRGLFSKDAVNYGTGGHLTIHVDNGDLVARLQNTKQSFTLNADDAIIPGQLHHAAVTFGPGGFKLYLDGVQKDANAYTGGLVGNAEPVVIGARQINSGKQVADVLSDFFDGTITKVALYDRALPASVLETDLQHDALDSLLV